MMTNTLHDAVYLFHLFYKMPATPAIDSSNKKRVVPYKKNYQNTSLEESIEFLNAGGYKDPKIKGAAAILKPNYIVIDVDTKHNIDGKLSLNDLSGYYDFDFYNKAGMVVNSPNGGWHLYYRLPEEYKNKPLRKALKSFLGVEFLTHKITVPNSVLNNGKTYRFEKLPKELLELPTDLLKDLAIKTTPITELSDNAHKDHEIDLKQFENILKAHKSIREGGRSDEVYRLACEAKDYGIAKNTALKLLAEFNGSKILPALEEEELATIVTNAYNYSQSKSASKSITAVFPKLNTNCDQLKTEDESWRKQLYLVNKGTTISTHKFVNKNSRLFLENLPKFKGQIKYSELLQKDTYKDKPLTDNDVLEIRDYLTETEGFDPSISALHEAIRVVALKNKFNPIKDYFNSLPKWDKVERLKRFFPDYCGSDDNSYTQELGIVICTAVVARAFNAGCTFDFMPVLVGEEYRGKSLVTKYLAIKPEWHAADLVGNLGSGEYIYQIKDKLIVESAELTMFERASDNEIKAFLSRTVDGKRLAYERTKSETPRRAIFIGTSNHTRFLRDPTSSRRFLPVEIKGGFRGENYTKELPLFYAEAFHYYKQKRPLTFLNPEAIKILKQEREDRYEQDPLSPRIFEWLKDKTEVKTSDILEKCLLKDFSTITKKDQSRIAAILRRLNWKRTTKRVDGQVLAVYKKHINQEVNNDN